MTKRSYFIFTAVLLLTVPLSLRAQNAQSPSALKDERPSRQVIGSVSETRIRFTCLGDLIQLRLEVFGPAGEILFDSEFKPGNVVDWPASDPKGQQPGDGTYLCVVSVKDASGEILRKHTIATVRDQSVSLREADKSLLSSAQSASLIAGEDVNVTIVQAGAAAAATLAHDGDTAHLVSGRGGLSISSGDFFANKLLEHIRITAEGNVGIGVSNPQARLDVAGRIRATEGLVFPDGSVQFSAARKTLGAASLEGGASQDVMPKDAAHTPDTSGTGTTGKIPKWLDGPNGVLTDSNIAEATCPQGSCIGIGTIPAANTPYKLDVLGHNRFRGPSVSFYLSGEKAGGNEWLFQTVDADGRFRIYDNTTFAERFAISQGTGNVGIGATNPSSKLEIAGSALLYPTSGPGSMHIRNRTTSDYSQVVFDDHVNAYRGYIGYIGANAGLGARNDTVEFGTQGTNMTFRPNEFELMRLTTAGRVGIGTPAPSFRLHVIDPSNTGLRVQTNATGGTVASFGGNGEFQIDAPSNPGGRLIVKENGDVGINPPAQKLHVSGTGIIRALVNSDSNAGLGLSLGGQQKWSVATTSPGNFQVFNDANGQNAMIIDGSSNNVGIGTAPSFYRLSVNTPSDRGLFVNATALGGTVAEFGSSGEFWIDNATVLGGRLKVMQDSTVLINNPPPGHPTDNADRLIVNGFIKTGLAGAGTAALCLNGSDEISLCGSSIRYKENVNDFSPGLNLIRRLRPVTFDWKQSQEHDLGLVAEEVAKVEPLLVTHNANGEIEGVKYDRVAVVLLNAVQEQQAQIKKAN